MSESNKNNLIKQAVAGAVKPIAKYLATLNPKQREAVEYGIKPGKTKDIGPLLVIAGAGSGKTNTLAHRVAHLVVNGADPHTILLLTFSRRAAREMTRPGAAHCSQCSEEPKGSSTVGWARFTPSALGCCGNMPTIIGLKPSFTILDRSDCGRLDEPGPPRPGAIEEGKPVSARRTPVLPSTRWRSIPGRRSNGSCPPGFRGALNGRTSCGALFAAYVKAKRRQNVLDYDDLLLYWAEMLRDKNIAAEIGGRFDHILVDEYQDTNRLQAEILLQVEARWSWLDGGRRRRPGDLFLPGRNRPQHPRLSRQI